MKQNRTQITGIPAVVYGEKADRVYLFVHGKGGNKDEAASFARIVSETGWQVLSIDLPEHGDRMGETGRFYPWIAVPELQKLWDYMQTHWDQVSLRANSIGAWFCMLAFQDKRINESLFVSPILDMEHLICNMMKWAGVTERELEARKTIHTTFGYTLSWEYLLYTKRNPIVWNCTTKILYGSEDNLTERSIVDEFVSNSHCELKVMERGEHWFHTEEQLAFLNAWEKQNTLLVSSSRATNKKER